MVGGDLQAYCNVGQQGELLLRERVTSESIRALSHNVKGVRLQRGVLDRIAAKLRSQRRANRCRHTHTCIHRPVPLPEPQISSYQISRRFRDRPNLLVLDRYDR